MSLKKPEPASNGVLPELTLSSAGDMLAPFPTVVEWLSSSKWDDGTPRATSTLRLGSADGRWKLMMVDTAGGRVLYLANAILEEACLELEQALLTGKGDWQKDRWASKRK